MAYNRVLAERLRDVLAGEPGVREKRMFGGLAFLVDGNMAVAASSGGGLMVRVDPAQTDALVAHEHVERFEMRGRKMDGWLHVAPEAVMDDDQLEVWAERGVAYARSLPPK